MSLFAFYTSIYSSVVMGSNRTATSSLHLGFQGLDFIVSMSNNHMAVKRNYDKRWEEKEGENPEIPQLKRNRSIVNASEGTRLQFMDTIPHIIEPFLREVVREEVEKALSCYLNSVPRSSSMKQIQPPLCRRWQLQFMKKLPGILFAGSKIEAEDYSPVQIAIVDTFSNAIVTSEHLSSLKVDIFVLDSDFGGEGQEDWTEREFNKSLIREREGKRPLLTGDTCITLTEGTAEFGDVSFTDNSSWTRSRKFRLGLRVQKNSAKGVGIKEAISEPFIVKDHRGELYKKHHPPSLADEVWRLEKIGKDGVFHKKLAEKGINTVRDLLTLLVVNHDGLRNMFGGGMSNRTWEAIVQHARECSVENHPCSYYSVPGVQLYFNPILEIAGVKFEGSYYQPFNELSVENQTFVNGLKEIAYSNHHGMSEIALLPPNTPKIYEDAILLPSPSSALGFPSFCSPSVKQGDLGAQIHFPHLVTPNTELPDDRYQTKQASDSQELHPIEQLISSRTTLSGRDLFVRQMQDNVAEACTSSWGTITCDSLVINNSAARMLNCLPYAQDFGIGDGIFNISVSENHVHNPSITPSKWVKLIAAIKCGMLIRKRLAAKRRARILRFSYQMYPNSHESSYDY